MADDTEFVAKSAGSKRQIRIATEDLDTLGPLRHLPGVWANVQPEHRDGSIFKGKIDESGQPLSPFDGRGWNLIALPFADPDTPRNYRLLMNQYNEVLTFSALNGDVPNRGVTQPRNPEEADQEISAIDYEQLIAQIAAEDISVSGTAGEPGLGIHHEPGFFLHMQDQRTQGFDVARLGTIPHGNSVTAIGRSREFEGPPQIPNLSGMPEGLASFPPGQGPDDILEAVKEASNPNSYLFPYHHFTETPFKGVVNAPGFPGFGPENANLLLQIGLPSNVKHTVELPLHTDVLEAGIVNIPFVERQADAAVMHSTFWIMELDEMNAKGEPRVLLAYSQFIFLDFFPRLDGRPGLIRWPHISINVMEKIAEPSLEENQSPVVMAAQYD